MNMLDAEAIRTFFHTFDKKYSEIGRNAAILIARYVSNALW